MKRRVGKVIGVLAVFFVAICISLTIHALERQVVGSYSAAMSGETVYTLDDIPDNYTGAVITVLGDPILWFADGSTPTSTSGKVLYEGSYYPITKDEVTNFEATLKSGGSAATLYVDYYGVR